MKERQTDQTERERDIVKETKTENGWKENNKSKTMRAREREREK